MLILLSWQFDLLSHQSFQSYFLSTFPQFSLHLSTGGPRGQYPPGYQDHGYQQQGFRGGPGRGRGRGGPGGHSGMHKYDEYDQYGAGGHDQYGLQPTPQNMPNQVGNGSHVVMVYGMDPNKMNCDRLFNLLCLYGNVWKASVSLCIMTFGVIRLCNVTAVENILKNRRKEVCVSMSSTSCLS